MIVIGVVAVMLIYIICKVGETKTINMLYKKSTQPMIVKVDGEAMALMKVGCESIYAMCKRASINIDEYVILVNGIGKTSKYEPKLGDVIELLK